MFDSIIYFVKEYFAIICYLLIIFNIVIRVIVTKKSKKKKKKKKSRKGGGILGDIWRVLLCIITFGLSCGFWDDSHLTAKSQFSHVLKELRFTTFLPARANTEKMDGAVIFGNWDDIGSLRV